MKIEYKVDGYTISEMQLEEIKGLLNALNYASTHMEDLRKSLDDDEYDNLNLLLGGFAFEMYAATMNAVKKIREGRL